MATVRKIAFLKFKLAAQISTEFVLTNGTRSRIYACLGAHPKIIENYKHVIFLIFVWRPFVKLLCFI